jgi:hypothetical protein
LIREQKRVRDYLHERNSDVDPHHTTKRVSTNVPSTTTAEYEAEMAQRAARLLEVKRPTRHAFGTSLRRSQSVGPSSLQLARHGSESARGHGDRPLMRHRDTIDGGDFQVRYLAPAHDHHRQQRRRVKKRRQEIQIARIRGIIRGIEEWRHRIHHGTDVTPVLPVFRDENNEVIGAGRLKRSRSLPMLMLHPTPTNAPLSLRAPGPSQPAPFPFSSRDLSKSLTKSRENIPPSSPYHPYYVDRPDWLGHHHHFGPPVPPSSSSGLPSTSIPTNEPLTMSSRNPIRTPSPYSEEALPAWARTPSPPIVSPSAAPPTTSTAQSLSSSLSARGAPSPHNNINNSVSFESKRSNISDMNSSRKSLSSSSSSIVPRLNLPNGAPITPTPPPPVVSSSPTSDEQPLKMKAYGRAFSLSQRSTAWQTRPHWRAPVKPPKAASKF